MYVNCVLCNLIDVVTDDNYLRQPYPCLATTKMEAWDYNPVSSLHGGYASFTFEVHVTPANDPPIIHGPNGSAFTGKEDSRVSLSAGGGIVLDDPDDPDTDGEFLDLTVTVGMGTLYLPISFAGGLYLLNGEQPAGSPVFSARGGLLNLNRALQRLTYQAPADWSGTDHMDVWVSDLGERAGGEGASEALASFVVAVEAVDDPPQVHVPGTVHYLDEDTSLAVDFVNISDRDPGSTLTVEFQPDYGVIEILAADLERETMRNVVVSRNPALGLEGEEQGGLTIRGLAEDVDLAVEMLTFTPTANFGGQVDVSVRVVDDTGLTADSNIYLYVRPINDPPAVNLPEENGKISTLKMTAGGTGDAITGLAISDVDAADNSNLCANIKGISGRNALSLKFIPSSGVVSIRAESAVGVWVVEASTAGPGETLLLRGSTGSLQAALDGGYIMYSAPADFAGRDKVVVVVDDGGNCGEGGPGSNTRALEVDVAPYEPPLAVVLDDSTAAGSVVFTQEGEPLTLPGVVITGGSVRERAAVEVVILAISGNVTLQEIDMEKVEIIDGTEANGERLRLRGSPAVLTAALVGMSFEPSPNFFGCWDRNGTCEDDTPVRSPRVQGTLALARVHFVGTSDGAGGLVTLEGDGSVRSNSSWSATSVKVSVGWLNDPPTLHAPEAITANKLEESPVPGVRVADADVLDAPQEYGRLEVNVSTSMGGTVAVDAVIALKNGLQDDGFGEEQVRLRGLPEYVNNVLETLTFSHGNATNSNISYVNGDIVDEILVNVSDLGFSGSGGEQRVSASILVEAGVAASSIPDNMFPLENMLPLVSTKEGSAVALPGLGTGLRGSSNSEEMTVVVAAKEGYLSLGRHGGGVAAAAAKEDWGPSVTLIETTGGAEQTLPEIQVNGSKVGSVWPLNRRGRT